MAKLQGIFENLLCHKSLLMLFNLSFFFIGWVYVFLGLWIITYFYKFMEMSSEFSDSIPYVFLAIGGSITLISLLACVCTAKGQPALLYLYGGYLTMIFVLILGTGVSVYTYRNKLLTGFDKGLNESMQNYRPGNVELIADFDEMQSTLKCCGNHRYSDWLDMSPPAPIPLSCCIKPDCDSSDESQIYTQGCYEKFMPLVGALFACILARSANKARYQQMA